jgi:hypothetical protein
MHGLVNTAVQILITSRFVASAWGTIKKDANVDEEEFVGMHAYPDEVTYALVASAMRHSVNIQRQITHMTDIAPLTPFRGFVRGLLMALLCVAAMSTIALAQETTGTITGTIVDAQGLALPGVSVTADGPRGVSQTTSNGAGAFTLPFLLPGDYSVEASLAGFQTAASPVVQVTVGQTISLAITLQVGNLAEVVQVTAVAPVIDTTSTTTGAVIDSDLLTNIPVGRRLASTLYLAPGVSSGGGTGASNPSIGGSSGLENLFVVDGANITNAGYGALGSYSIVFGSLGNGVTFDFIDQVQVKTGGYEAEFGQSTGGVVNVITKSGTNVFSGNLFSYFSPGGFSGENRQVQSRSGDPTVSIVDAGSNDVGMGFGLPLVRDRLFFYGSYNPQFDTTTLRAAGEHTLESLGDVARKRTTQGYSGKFTYQPNGANRLNLSLFGDPATGAMGPQRSSALLREDTAGFSRLSYGGNNQVLRYEAVPSSSWLMEFQYARANNKIVETPSVDSWSVVDLTGAVRSYSGGIGYYEQGNNGTNQQWSFKSTNVFAGHELRYGFLIEDIAYDNVIQRTGPTFTLPNGERTTTGALVYIYPDANLGRVYRVVRANTGNVRETTQTYASWFVQDSIRMGRLTLNPGLRYEQQSLVGNLADFSWTGNYAPRVGFVYDLRGDGRSRLYANWGRYFSKIPNDLAARALSADAGVTRADYYDANLTNPIPNGVSALNTTTHFIQAGLHPSDFDPDAKSTYMNESVFGYEWEIAPSTSLGLRYITRGFGRILEDVGTAPMAAYFLGLPGLDSVEYFITNVGPNTPTVAPELGASFESVVHDYDSLEATLDRRLRDNWSLQASYRWSRTYGNFEGFFRNDNGQSDPAITSLFDFPTNDPSYVGILRDLVGARGDIRYLGNAGNGPLPNDRTHDFKLYTYRNFENGLNLGLAFSGTSGAPLTAMAANPAYDNSGEIPETPRGGGIQTVDGFKTRVPFSTKTDFHADYGFDTGTGSRLVLVADVFNLFNQRSVTSYDYRTELSLGYENPDFGIANGFRSARSLRLGLRFDF